MIQIHGLIQPGVQSLHKKTAADEMILKKMKIKLFLKPRMRYSFSHFLCCCTFHADTPRRLHYIYQPHFYVLDIYLYYAISKENTSLQTLTTK